MDLTSKTINIKNVADNVFEMIRRDIFWKRYFFLAVGRTSCLVALQMFVFTFNSDLVFIFNLIQKTKNVLGTKNVSSFQLFQAKRRSCICDDETHYAITNIHTSKKRIRKNTDQMKWWRNISWSRLATHTLHSKTYVKMSLNEVYVEPPHTLVPLTKINSLSLCAGYVVSKWNCERKFILKIWNFHHWWCMPNCSQTESVYVLNSFSKLYQTVRFVLFFIKFSKVPKWCDFVLVIEFEFQLRFWMWILIESISKWDAHGEFVLQSQSLF